MFLCLGRDRDFNFVFWRRLYTFATVPTAVEDGIINEMRELLPRCMTADWVRLGSRLSRWVRERGGRPELEGLLAEARRSVRFRLRRAERMPRVEHPPELPITSRAEEIVDLLRRYPVLVIAGETGSGKTTQIPKMCLAAGFGIAGKIACTQPRRVAATSVSRRIAEELGVEWGREVGCKIRFDDRSHRESYIKMMTDGMLLAELQADPDLAEYEVVIIDEAHERSLNIDFLLGHLKRLLDRRDDLKVIITSATIDTRRFSEHFNDAPVIEVSGRVYPVQVEYRPLDGDREERGEVSYIDAAAEATMDVLCRPERGDVLIFMPGERDIRETRDRVLDRLGDGVEVVPLFGRLGVADQQRVFARTQRPKVVIATNIAETSLTIPGIRYVIDPGLARISRYSPRSRTRRLPVEPVSQSSANQRQGRAGRMQDGVCIRLYSEAEFVKRPPFTQPEIQRANLAEVILRMKAFDLGDIESFPFVQAPPATAIAAGYKLLRELGAIDTERRLTRLGEKLARLPIDPTLGRMLLQAQEEHVTRELLIIAAGLSIQDPRERPLDQQAEAEAAHRRFRCETSDFIGLLRIWNAVHDEWESLPTQNQRRRFCRRHFLSYLRMREWQDLHAQLLASLRDLGEVDLNQGGVDEEAIHRSILSGLIAHVARWEERNVYRAAGNRLVKVFPGSVLHDRRDKPGKGRRGSAGRPEKAVQPRWLVAGELVETSQLFARTLAGIDPQWVLKLAPHCCQTEHREPHWSAASGRVLVSEVVILHGMELARRKVPYGRVNPGEATAIFIRHALVDGLSDEEEEESEGGNATAVRHPFVAANRAVCRKVEEWLTRVRRHDVLPPDEALCRFYAARLPDLSSVHELNAWMKAGSGARLEVTEADLVGDERIDWEDDAFPERLTVGGQSVKAVYAYAPGEDHDGVTVELPFNVAQGADSATLEWAVPGLRAKLALELLRSLPKSLRRSLMPLHERAEVIARELQPEGASLVAALGGFVRERFGVTIPPESWSPEAVPTHLRIRAVVLGRNGTPIRAGRDLNQLRPKQSREAIGTEGEEPPEWRDAAAQWERFDLKDWIIGNPPERVTVREHDELPLYAWPALLSDTKGVHFRLQATPEQARRTTPEGYARLIAIVLQKDLAWLERDLRALQSVRDLYAPLGSVEELCRSALQLALREAMPIRPVPSLREDLFREAVGEARGRLAGLAPRIVDAIKTVLETRQRVAAKIGLIAPSAGKPGRTLTDLSQLDALTAGPGGEPALAGELRRLLPPRFPEQVSLGRMAHLPRYLRALEIRHERARLNPVKDAERAAQVMEYAARWGRLAEAADRSAATRDQLEELRWMLEEYRVSLFAQELGTAVKVSPKRLDALIEGITGHG